MFFNQVHSLKAILPLAYQVDFWKCFQQERELVTGGFFVVNDERIDGHGYVTSV